MKIGRNELCYCGSGIKYKRCCLNKDQEAPDAARRPEPTVEAAGLSQENGATPASVSAPTLEEIRQIAETGIRWESEAYAVLANQLIANMEGAYEPRHIVEALSIWDNFSREKRPSFKKEGAFCAALEYMIVQAYGLPVTQNELALKYEVSSSTLSKRYQELLQFADEYFGSEPDGSSAQSGSKSLSPELEAERTLRRQQTQRSGATPAPEMKAAAPAKAGRKSAAGSAAAASAVAVAPGASSSEQREMAQELLYTAMGTASAQEAAKLAHAALELHPHSADAYVVLARHTSDAGEKKRLLAEGIAAGEQDLAGGELLGGDSALWSRAEVRPYLRAKLAYAEACWELKESAEAAGQLEELLKLNPTDEQGARHLLLAAYLEQDRLDEAEQLLDTFREDQSVAFAYDRLLYAYKKLGRATAELNAPYLQAKRHNPHVLDFFFGGKPLPKPGSGTTKSAAEEEAVIYVTTHIRLWIKLPELLVWLYKQGR
ncbi:helix-turn-helix, Psq domain [Paenibacillus sp. UNCCL117]|uniref:SEC-C metal-binding domain-containing protein n=1 Tax=unclassified Paenibacillus TaxID=185978 RepID=UPI000889884C|nr:MULTISPECIES: SEC-C metal-binding domain-containing protein [unclassified Paenibacillus]SDE65823.1 helix-turn-helix, Psq domain [Paenibacillus sp. cl123]SFW70371.1 helix-turn-helix, Psq domain [Paenibacillus sp. UNCCL117]